MAPQATPAKGEAEPDPKLTKHELPTDKAKYIVNKLEMEKLLKKTFGAGIEFQVSTKSGRWIYYAERKLTDREVSEWIAELDKQKKKAQGQARASAGVAESSGESGAK